MSRAAGLARPGAVRRRSFAVVVLGWGVASPAFAAPDPMVKLEMCFASPTGGGTCPRLDPKKGTLESLAVNFHSQDIYALQAEAATVSSVKFKIEGQQYIYVDGASFDPFPIVGTGTMTVGPVGTQDPTGYYVTMSGESGQRTITDPAMLARFVGSGQVHLTAVNEFKKVDLPGATLKSYKQILSNTQISIGYYYRIKLKMPKVDLPPQKLPKGPLGPQPSLPPAVKASSP